MWTRSQKTAASILNYTVLSDYDPKPEQCGAFHRQFAKNRENVFSRGEAQREILLTACGLLVIIELKKQLFCTLTACGKYIHHDTPLLPHKEIVWSSRWVPQSQIDTYMGGELPTCRYIRVPRIDCEGSAFPEFLKLRPDWNTNRHCVLSWSEISFCSSFCSDLELFCVLVRLSLQHWRLESRLCFFPSSADICPCVLKTVGKRISFCFQYNANVRVRQNGKDGDAVLEGIGIPEWQGNCLSLWWCCRLHVHF